MIYYIISITNYALQVYLKVFVVGIDFDTTVTLNIILT